MVSAWAGVVLTWGMIRPAIFSKPLPSDVPPGRLQALARLGDYEGCRELLAAGVPVDQLYEGETALLEACREGHMRLTGLLLEHGANPNACTAWEHPLTVLPWGFRRTLHHAYQLREAGADLAHLPHARVLSQRTSIRAMRLLLEWGLDANALDDDGYSRLYWTAKEDQWRMCELLLQHGARANLMCPDGRYPWECASDPKLRQLLHETKQQHDVELAAQKLDENTVAAPPRRPGVRL